MADHHHPRYQSSFNWQEFKQNGPPYQCPYDKMNFNKWEEFKMHWYKNHQKFHDKHYKQMQEKDKSMKQSTDPDKIYNLSYFDYCNGQDIGKFFARTRREYQRKWEWLFNKCSNGVKQYINRYACDCVANSRSAQMDGINISVHASRTISEIYSWLKQVYIYRPRDEEKDSLFRNPGEWYCGRCNNKNVKIPNPEWSPSCLLQDCDGGNKLIDDNIFIFNPYEACKLTVAMDADCGLNKWQNSLDVYIMLEVYSKSLKKWVRGMVMDKSRNYPFYQIIVPDSDLQNNDPQCIRILYYGNGAWRYKNCDRYGLEFNIRPFEPPQLNQRLPLPLSPNQNYTQRGKGIHTFVYHFTYFCICSDLTILYYYTLWS